MAFILREGHMVLVSPFSVIKDKKLGILLVTYLLLFKMIYGHYPLDDWRSINRRKRNQWIAAWEHPLLKLLYKKLYTCRKNVYKQPKDALESFQQQRVRQLF